MYSLEASRPSEDAHPASRKAYLDLNSEPNSTLLSSISSSSIGEVVISDSSGAMLLSSTDSFSVEQGRSAPGAQQFNDSSSGTALADAAPVNKSEEAIAGSGASPSHNAQAKTTNRLITLLSSIRDVSQLTLNITQPQNVNEVMLTLPDALQGVCTRVKTLAITLPEFDPSLGAALSALIASPDSKLKHLVVSTSRVPITSSAVFALAEALRSNTGLDALDLHNVAVLQGAEAFDVLQSALNGNVMRGRPLQVRVNGEERTISTEQLRST